MLRKEVQKLLQNPEEKEDAAQRRMINPKLKEAEEDSDTRYMRLMADFQNYKGVKRRKVYILMPTRNLVTELLDVDNFERALDQEGQRTASRKIWR